LNIGILYICHRGHRAVGVSSWADKPFLLYSEARLNGKTQEKWFSFMDLLKLRKQRAVKDCTLLSKAGI
jgi:hypothetical protein